MGFSETEHAGTGSLLDAICLYIAFMKDIRIAILVVSMQLSPRCLAGRITNKGHKQLIINEITRNHKDAGMAVVNHQSTQIKMAIPCTMHPMHPNYTVQGTHEGKEC